MLYCTKLFIGNLLFNCSSCFCHWDIACWNKRFLNAWFIYNISQHTYNWSMHIEADFLVMKFGKVESSCWVQIRTFHQGSLRLLSPGLITKLSDNNHPQVDLLGQPRVQPTLPDHPQGRQQPDQPDQRSHWPARAGETLLKSFEINDSLEVHAKLSWPQSSHKDDLDPFSTYSFCIWSNLKTLLSTHFPLPVSSPPQENPLTHWNPNLRRSSTCLTTWFPTWARWSAPRRFAPSTSRTTTSTPSGLISFDHRIVTMWYQIK